MAVSAKELLLVCIVHYNILRAYENSTSPFLIPARAVIKNPQMLVLDEAVSFVNEY